jgi:CMP-N,N'-diacetyllegionaminic acid synthase
MLTKKILAIIPARAASKGLPNKNIKVCAGKPLVQWTIEASLESKLVSKTLVTTDSIQVQEIANSCGAWTPFLRKGSLSQDNSSITDVIKDALQWCEKEKKLFDYVMLLEPTSPLRNSGHIDDAIQNYFKVKRTNKEILISVKEIENTILWALGSNSETGYMYPLFGFDKENPQRQELSRCYLPNGCIFLAPICSFDGFYTNKIIPYLMDEKSSVDIDNQLDFNLAENLLLR